VEHAGTQVPVGWLLRVSRRQGADARWRKASHFAAAFQGGSWPRAVSASTISRWETGRLVFPIDAASRYEELLELPFGSLSSPIVTLARYRSAPATRLPRSRIDSYTFGLERRLDAMVEQGVAGEMDGSGWLELTNLLLAGPPVVIILPQVTRGRLVEVLLEQMIVAEGYPWLQRFEAFNRLAAHPYWQEIAIDIAIATATDRRHSASVEATSLLDGTRHPMAARWLVTQLVNPTTNGILYGALLASVRARSDTSTSHTTRW
jgi:hypothetical protein